MHQRSGDHLSRVQKPSKWLLHTIYINRLHSSSGSTSMYKHVQGTAWNCLAMLCFKYLFDLWLKTLSQHQSCLKLNWQHRGTPLYFTVLYCMVLESTAAVA